MSFSDKVNLSCTVNMLALRSASQRSQGDNKEQ